MNFSVRGQFGMFEIQTSMDNHDVRQLEVYMLECVFVSFIYFGSCLSFQFIVEGSKNLMTIFRALTSVYDSSSDP